MAINIFVYGSLMYPNVWNALVRAGYGQVPVLLRNFQRFAVRDETYPAIVPLTGAEVRGLVRLDVDPEDLVRLDRFEGGDYVREVVTVESLDPGRPGTIEATAYVWKDRSRLLDAVWDPDRFARVDLDGFVRRFLPPG